MNGIDINLLVDEYQQTINNLTKDLVYKNTLLKQAYMKINELEKKNDVKPDKNEVKSDKKEETK